MKRFLNQFLYPSRNKWELNMEIKNARKFGRQKWTWHHISNQPRRFVKKIYKISNKIYSPEVWLLRATKAHIPTIWRTFSLVWRLSSAAVLYTATFWRQICLCSYRPQYHNFNVINLQKAQFFNVWWNTSFKTIHVLN